MSGQPLGLGLERGHPLVAREPGGRAYVEVHPDSLESDSVRKARPKYKSDGGRIAILLDDFNALA